jgi:hypothetical protein
MDSAALSSKADAGLPSKVEKNRSGSSPWIYNSQIRNQQVAGSIPAGGSIEIKHLSYCSQTSRWYFRWYFSLPDIESFAHETADPLRNVFRRLAAVKLLFQVSTNRRFEFRLQRRGRFRSG